LGGLNEVVKKAGKPSELTGNLLEVLAENGRLNTLDKVIESYSELMSAHRNELPLVVTSAKVKKEIPMIFIMKLLLMYIAV
jgi:F-type H+-transporting ATPase subunit O